jgi:8-amino-7-oxononanoate synthase
MMARRRFLKGATAGLLAIGGGLKQGFSQVAGNTYKFIMGSGPGAETVINGKKCLYFGGTGYFGFQTHPEVIKAAQEALEEYGLHSATSRNIFGNNSLYLSLEKKAAEFFGTEDAICLASGYLINIAALQALVQLNRFEAIFMDETAHYSIADFIYAVRKPVFSYRHGDPEDLSRQLKANLKAAQRPLVATDGIFPTFGKVAPIPEYLKAIEPYDGSLWLDDCHAIGILGANGRGTYEYYGLESNRLFFGGTLSKAVGGHGGIIPGGRAFIDPIRAGHVVNGANASTSAAAAAALTGLQLMMSHPELRQTLWRNARQLKKGLRNLGFDQDNSPVPIAAWELKRAEDMDRVQEELMKRGISIQRTRYVGAGKNGALRAVVFATHTPEQIDRLLGELKTLV